MTNDPSADEPITEEAAEAAARQAEERAAQARARAAELRSLAEDSGSAETATVTPRRRARWGVVATAAMLTALCVLGGLSAAMLWQRHTADQQRQRVAEYSAVAKQGVINLMSLDFNDASGAVQRVIDGATGKFKEEFSAESPQLVKALKESQVKTEVTVNSVAVEKFGEDTAVVLVAANSRASNVNDPRKDPQKFRVAVTLATDNGQLKIAQVDFV